MRTPENSPYGLRGYIFLTSKATAAKAPQESLFRVKAGKPFNSRTAPAFDQFTSYSLAESFFHANVKSSNTVRKFISFGCTLIGSAFNMGTFTAKDSSESLLEEVKSPLSAQV